MSACAPAAAGETPEVPFVRAFMGIEIDSCTRARLVRVQQALKRSGAHVSWVPAGNIHLSLEFLGNTARDKLTDLSQALAEACRAVSPFDLAVCGIGTFGGSRSPRVIWAGVEPCPPLTDLQARLHGLLRALDIPLEDRPFKPHLTLGRVRSARGRQALAAALPAFEIAAFGCCRVKEAVLLQSILHPGGAEYRRLSRALLGV